MWVIADAHGHIFEHGVKLQLNLEDATSKEGDGKTCMRTIETTRLLQRSFI